MEALATINSIATIILVLITGVYVVLTGFLLREARRARQSEKEPNLVATLIPLDGMSVKLRIYNAGIGPAVDVSVDMFFEPLSEIAKTKWIQPVLLGNSFEDFRLPGLDWALDKLAATHDRLVVDMHWADSFGHAHQHSLDFRLKELSGSWTTAGQMIPPDDTATQLGKIRDELKAIRETGEALSRELTLKRLEAEHGHSGGLLGRLIGAVKGRTQ